MQEPLVDKEKTEKEPEEAKGFLPRAGGAILAPLAAGLVQSGIGVGALQGFKRNPTGNIKDYGNVYSDLVKRLGLPAEQVSWQPQLNPAQGPVYGYDIPNLSTRHTIVAGPRYRDAALAHELGHAKAHEALHQHGMGFLGGNPIYIYGRYDWRCSW